MKKLKDYLLENYVKENGDLMMSGLDFSDFDGDVYMSVMKVKGNLYQNYHKVKGTLHQDEIKELTVEEISKLLGYRVKIRKENRK